MDNRKTYSGFGETNKGIDVPRVTAGLPVDVALRTTPNYVDCLEKWGFEKQSECVYKDIAAEHENMFNLFGMPVIFKYVGTEDKPLSDDKNSIYVAISHSTLNSNTKIIRMFEHDSDGYAPLIDPIHKEKINICNYVYRTLEGLEIIEKIND